MTTLLRCRRAHLAIFQRGGYDPIRAALRLAEIFARFPVAFLEGH